MANNIKKKRLSLSDIGTLIGFVFSLGARRKSDFSNFFKQFSNNLSDMKTEESKLLGLCQSEAVANNWKAVVEILNNIAEIEKKFKKLLLSL